MRYFGFVISSMLSLLLLLSACGSGTPSGGQSNNKPTGSLIINGTPMVGETLTLTSTIADSDGLGSITFQWRRSGEDIIGASGQSYLIDVDDIDHVISVQGRYLDGKGNAETVISESTSTVAPAPQSSKPNILLIISDDQGVDSFSQYGYSSDLPNTPNLDTLAENGIVFDNAWATPACTTTRGSMMTGQHGINSGITYVPASMDTSSETLFRYLKSDSNTEDYAGAVIGKWHLGGANSDLTHPSDSGIEYFAGLLEGTVDSYESWPLTINGVTVTSYEYHTSKVTDLAIDWIDAQQQPWLLWLAFVAPHSPFHLPPEHLHNRMELTGSDEDIEARKRDYYFAAIEAMDTEIGRLLESLSDEERENTLIIFIGDNGTPAPVIDRDVFIGAHSKGTLYEGGIRVPMLVSGFGVSRTQTRESTLVNTTDLYATIAQVAGSDVESINDSYSFYRAFSEADLSFRAYNYSEFESDEVTGWTVRNDQYKLIEFSNGDQELYDVNSDISEEENLLLDSTDRSELLTELSTYADAVRNIPPPVDITDAIFTERSANCADYAKRYTSSVLDVGNNIGFSGALEITVVNDKCIFRTNAIPNHHFNDGESPFPNNVSEQNDLFEITTSPEHAANATELSLTTDNALMLNGVKVDLLAAGCYGIGNGRIGCNDINQPWRYDPMFEANGFQVDSHNAHAQSDGTYHYHGTPNAFYVANDQSSESPLVGFAADGYPIFGPYFDDSGTVRKALSSFRLKSGNRPNGADDPGGSYDGAFRDDYEYVEGEGDLDECNGMMVNNVYGYYITDNFPYIISCFKGTPDPSFDK